MIRGIGTFNVLTYFQTWNDASRAPFPNINITKELAKLSKRKWAIPGKQDWRYGMNQSGIYGAKILVNLETTKGVIAY